VNPNAPRPEPKVFLGELWFVLSGLCDEIGLRETLGQPPGATVWFKPTLAVRLRACLLRPLADGADFIGRKA